MAICVGNIIYQAEEACTDIELFVIGLGGLMVMVGLGSWLGESMNERMVVCVGMVLY
jgi:hypothetical protein